jgi:hypothetical protein
MKRSDQLGVLVDCRIPTDFCQVLTFLTYAEGVRFESQPEGFWHMQEGPALSLNKTPNISTLHFVLLLIILNKHTG